MRISDEKRREIAASLRESREFISGLPKTSLEQNAFDTCRWSNDDLQVRPTWLARAYTASRREAAGIRVL